MACLVAGHSGNAELLRKASAAAREHHGELYAVVVDSHRSRFDKVEVRGLMDDAILGSELGAKIVWLDSSDVVGELLQVARQVRIGQIFVTRDRPALFPRLLGRAVYFDLLSRAEGFRVNVVGFLNAGTENARRAGASNAMILVTGESGLQRRTLSAEHL